MPKVSVLLTCYNHFAYVVEAVDSIRGQTFRDLEIIAVDDGSTDGTREWLAAQSDIRCILNEANLGTYASLNAGLANAQGEFIAILNDDDRWAPRKLELQVEAMSRASERPIGIVHTGGGFIDEAGAPTDRNPYGFSYPTLRDGRPLPELAYANRIIVSAVLIRAAAFEQVGNFNEAYFGSGDWEMWIRIGEAFDAAYVDEPLTFYRIHSGNASQSQSRVWQDDECIRLWLEARIPKWGLSASAEREVLAHNAACLGTVRMLRSHPKDARKSYALAIRRKPRRWKSYLRWLLTFLPAKAFRRSI